MGLRLAVGAVCALASLGCPGSSTCDSSSGEVADHANLEGSETWWPGSHHVTRSIVVARSFTLTLKPCARVLLDPDVGFAVAGALLANGTPTQPISFEPAEPGRPWGSIALAPHGAVELSSATLSLGGGAAPVETSGALGAPLFAQGSDIFPFPQVKLTDVDIEQATGVGVALIEAGFDAASSNLTVRGAGSFAAYLGFDAIDTVPTGSYSGNAKDAIALQTAFNQGQSNERAVARSLTVHDRGVPYVVGMKSPGTLLIRGNSMATEVPVVTVEPGVTFQFTRGPWATGQLVVDGDTSTGPTRALGALVAVGEAERPIVFTSAEAVPRPGDWAGLRFFGVDAATQLTHVELRSAGGNVGLEGVCATNAGSSPFDADAALQVYFERGAPRASFFQASTIVDSAGSGILRGWASANVDFASGNTLTRIAWCAQTPVKDKLQGCLGACTPAP